MKAGQLGLVTTQLSVYSYYNAFVAEIFFFFFFFQILLSVKCPTMRYGEVSYEKSSSEIGYFQMEQREKWTYISSSLSQVGPSIVWPLMYLVPLLYTPIQILQSGSPKYMYIEFNHRAPGSFRQ